MTPRPPQPLEVTDLGRLAYVDALDTQRRLNQAVIDGSAPPTLLLVEHEPVITISHRRDAGKHLLASNERLRALGIDVQPTDRGGDITYHGPGQLVAYPIVRLTPLGLNLGRYMRLLEQVVIATLADFGVHGTCERGATGVWVDPERFRVTSFKFQVEDKEACGSNPSAMSKICAMGVRVRKNTTMHGLALNVNTDLSHFDTIVPCGLHGRSVTSLTELLGDDAPTMPQTKEALVARLQSAVHERLNGA